MGNITRRELQTFVSHVFEKLDLNGWRIEWTKGYSICIRERKLILIQVHNIRFRLYRGYPWQAKEAVLHEIAHIFTSDKFHSEAFYIEYIKLLTKFMVEEAGSVGLRYRPTSDVIIEGRLLKRFRVKYGASMGLKLLVFYSDWKKGGEVSARAGVKERTFYNYRKILYQDGFLTDDDIKSGGNARWVK